MTPIDQRDHRQDCRDAEVANDRAAILAALSGEVTRRLSKQPVPPRRHAVDRKRAHWRPLQRHPCHNPPPFDRPTGCRRRAGARTSAAASPVDLQRLDDRELTWTEVHELQIRLRALRFDPGPRDGVKGPLTSRRRATLSRVTR